MAVNEKRTLPPDLQKWAKKRRILKIATVILLYLTTCAVIFGIEMWMGGRGRLGIKLFFQILSMIPSVYLTMTKNFFDRTFCGKIARVSVKTSTV